MTSNPINETLESNEERLNEAIEHSLLSPLQARVILLIQHRFEKEQMVSPLDTTEASIDNALYHIRCKRRISENTIKILNANYEDLHHQTNIS